MSTATAPRLYPVYDPVHLIGTVSGRETDGDYTVDCDGRPWRVRRAASCLLAPHDGDQVLISGPDASCVYLIAVLAQADPGMARLEAEGDVVLSSRAGSVTLESPADVVLRSQAMLRVESARLDLRTPQARCVIERLRYVGAEAQATVGTTRLVGKVYETVMDRLSFLSRLAFRSTDEVEHVRAGTLDYQAAQSARLHAAYTMVTGDDLVKVDAKQIHMG